MAAAGKVMNMFSSVEHETENTEKHHEWTRGRIKIKAQHALGMACMIAKKPANVGNADKTRERERILCNQRATRESAKMLFEHRATIVPQEVFQLSFSIAVLC